MYQKTATLNSLLLCALFGMMLLFGTTEVNAQDLKPAEKSAAATTSLSLEGMIAVSVGNRLVAFNVGGPVFMVKFNSAFKVGVTAFPSFFILKGKEGLRLGAGPRIDYKNLVIFGAFYHFDRTDTWIGSVGLGYKFHGKK